MSGFVVLLTHELKDVWNSIDSISISINVCSFEISKRISAKKNKYIKGVWTLHVSLGIYTKRSIYIYIHEPMSYGNFYVFFLGCVYGNFYGAEIISYSFQRNILFRKQRLPMNGSMVVFNSSENK